MRAWRGDPISQTAVIWVGCGLVMAARWGVVSVINKRLLEDVHPVPLNFLVRIVAIGGLVALTVPLTGTASLALRLRHQRRGVPLHRRVGLHHLAGGVHRVLLRLARGKRRRRGPLTSTDPLWTAVFSLLLIGVALRAATLVGMAVTILGVVLISRWMEGGAGAMAGPAEGRTASRAPS